MARKSLDHFASYEWTGSFWFPDEPDKQFVGKITYSPEAGIRLEFLSTVAWGKNSLNKKILHGNTIGEQAGHITLFNVMLDPGSIHLGQSTLRTFYGSAEFLLQGFLVEEEHFECIEVQYEQQFENIFFFPLRREQEILAFVEQSASSPLSPESDLTIRLAMDTWGTDVSSEDVDSLFFAEDSAKFQVFKENFIQLLNSSDMELLQRTSLTPTFKIEKPQSTLESLFKAEASWRSFWGLLIDQELFPTSIWLQLSYTIEGSNEARTELKPLLKNFYQPLKEKNSRQVRIQPHLPLNITSFGPPAHDIAIVSSSITRWFAMKGDPRWISITYGISRLLQNKQKLADRAHYVSLLAEIKTLLVLIGVANTRLDHFIDTYATDTWKQELSTILTTLNGDPLGQFLSDIRNLMAHPENATQYARHLVVLENNTQFQKVYAYLAGLYIQVVLQELGGISNADIEEYVKRFIEARGSWITPEYLN